MRHGVAIGVSEDDFHVAVSREILACSLREVGLELEGSDAAARFDQLGQQRGVVAGAGADMGDGFARLRLDLADPHGVQDRLAIVDAFVGIEHHKHVLVDVTWIGSRRFEPAVAGKDGPRPGPEKGLARHRGEYLLNAGVGGARMRGHQFGIEFSGVVRSGHASRR